MKFYYQYNIVMCFELVSSLCDQNSKTLTLLPNQTSVFNSYMTEFLKSVQIYFKRYPTCIWLLNRCVITFQVSLSHLQSTLIATSQEKWFCKKLNRSGTAMTPTHAYTTSSTIHFVGDQRLHHGFLFWAEFRLQRILEIRLLQIRSLSD